MSDFDEVKELVIIAMLQGDKVFTFDCSYELSLELLDKEFNYLEVKQLEWGPIQYLQASLADKSPTKEQLSWLYKNLKRDITSAIKDVNYFSAYLQECVGYLDLVTKELL